jgi:hypothetical protein
MSGGELDEPFGFAEDPEFLQVCERGRVAFSEAVVENSVRRSVEMVRRDRVDQSERSAPARQRGPRVGSGVRLAVPDYVEVLMNRGARVTGTRRAKLVVLRGPQPSRGKHPRRHRGDLLSERLPRTLRRAAPPATRHCTAICPPPLVGAEKRGRASDHGVQVREVRRSAYCGGRALYFGLGLDAARWPVSCSPTMRTTTAPLT